MVSLPYGQFDLQPTAYPLKTFNEGDSMETDLLKKALVDFLVQVVLEVKARTLPSIQAEFLSMLETRRSLVESEDPGSSKPSPPGTGRFVSVKQAADVWGTSPVAFRRTLERMFPELPKGIVVRLGRRVRVDLAALEKWLVNRGSSPRR